jgi:hypothetical protein
MDRGEGTDAGSHGAEVGAGAPTVEEAHVLVYELDLRAPACVLLQAATGCGAQPRALRHFQTRYWLVALTPGMCKIAATDEQWSRVAELTRARWGSSRPSEAARSGTSEPRRVR